MKGNSYRRKKKKSELDVAEEEVAEKTTTKNDGKKFSKEDINTCMRYAPIVTDSQSCDTDENVYINTYMQSPSRKSRAP